MNAEASTIYPTVLCCLDPQRDEAIAATVPTEIGRALLVFRSGADAEAFMQANARLLGEGIKPVNLGDEEIAEVLAWHSLSAVAMPEAWTGHGRVDLFTAENFLRLLKESAPV